MVIFTFFLNLRQITEVTVSQRILFSYSGETCVLCNAQKYSISVKAGFIVEISPNGFFMMERKINNKTFPDKITK